MILTGGNVPDCRGFDALYATIDENNVIETAAMDKAYDSNEIRDCLAREGIAPVIPPKANRREALPYNAELYKERNRVERFFCKLKEFRRVATRYDKLQNSFFAFVCLAAAFISLK